MTRPLRALIDLAALRHNHDIARQHAGKARLWCVVKASAYGHGLERAVRALQDVADGFALVELEQAIALRERGLSLPLLLLEGFYSADEIPLFIRHRLTPVLHRQDQVSKLLAAGWPRDLPVYLKIDSGMHRLGFDAQGLAAVLPYLQDRIAEIALMTHFADADGTRGVDWQLARFETVRNGYAGTCSLANSAALLRFPHAIGDWARPGIMLYGSSPFPESISASALGLRPVMSLQSEIIGVQNLAAGESVGYGCTFTAKQTMRVGIVACGYADGYPRHAPTGTPVLVGDVETRTLGRVSMDKLCIDLSKLPVKVDVGATVTLWGRAMDVVLPADAVAAAAGTISYELFCALSQRVAVSEIGC